MTETIEKAINKACKELPPRWYISIVIEAGAAWVELTNGDGVQAAAFLDTTDKTLAEQIEGALEIVKNKSGCP